LFFLDFGGNGYASKFGRAFDEKYKSIASTKDLESLIDQNKQGNGIEEGSRIPRGPEEASKGH